MAWTAKWTSNGYAWFLWRVEVEFVGEETRQEAAESVVQLHHVSIQKLSEMTMGGDGTRTLDK